MIVFLFIGCDSENAFNCIKKEGTIIQTEISVSSFDKIIVFRGVQLFIEEGSEQKVMLETGENLLEDIEFKVENNTLLIIDNTGCNFIRDYGTTKVIVITPNLIEIRNSSGFAVKSNGIISFPNLTLLTDEDYLGEEFHTDGDFILNLDIDELKIISNGISNYYLSGSANKAIIGFYAGDSRLEAENFLINELTIYHRGSNKMIVNPLNELKGEIRGVGDVISKNRPPIVEVEEFYTGRLIFDD